ncbi:4-methyl-5(B-hydroxyethyl)-thiazole monophosphate biosynthesis protein [Agarivorans sp. Toyoura001]|uniref:DJ-1 family glyoxalase III n=1 Tax=Agarivorans sp. Toyoura001 TaxID=2283141 RepID=UPI0010D69C86|nr:DJ-1 family glyoxalase III [Agarivorans sp. Toyoura001]GDY24934.1 4-methyl-5(B-hydroxyethyl)-thiazole monophosphate biosynthesis protein [Agarivorans sp. Toyoura001]
MTKVMVAIAPGSEEIEAVTIIDVLRRADVTVDVVSVCPAGSLEICASRGVKLLADLHLNQIDASAYDMLVLPGGVPGSEVFRDSIHLIEILKNRSNTQWLAAICAAPALVLVPHNLLGEAQVTCHPGFQKDLPKQLLSTQRVVVDKTHQLITSQGPGTALEFSLALVAQLKGQDCANAVAAPMVLA